MKMRTLNINHEDWIKKVHYDRISKKKVKIIKEDRKLIAPDNFSNTVCAVRWDDEEAIKEIIGEKPKQFFEELKFMNPEGDNPLRVIVKNTIYSYEYFIMAGKIAEAFGYESDEPTIYISSKKNCPVLLNFNRISVIIAPRIDDDALGGKKVK